MFVIFLFLLSSLANKNSSILVQCIFKWVRLSSDSKSFKSFVTDYTLFNLFDYFRSCFSVLSGIVQLICWPGRVVLSLSFNYLDCSSVLVLPCFFCFVVWRYFSFYIYSTSKAENCKFSEWLLPLTNSIWAREVILTLLLKNFRAFAWFDFNHT